MILKRNDIEELDKIYRLNLINSISGIKPANLIGTKSADGANNLAVFSSIIHLGSNPAQIGFILRPSGEIPRHSFENIKETKHYTINHIPNSLIKNAHYTSAKIPKDKSEFDIMNIKEEFIDDFWAPFVKNSPVKIGMKFIDNIVLPNKCSLVIGSVELVCFPENAIDQYGQLNLEKTHTSGISGLNTYYEVSILDSFPYAREKNIPKF